MGREMAARTGLLTADEYYVRAQRTHEFSELVRGEVRPVSPASGRHGVVGGNLFFALRLHLREHPIGRAFGDNTGFRLPIPDAEDDTVRSPDAAFVSFERMPDVPAGFAPVAPDLAVEVLSPGDTASELQERLDDYFAAGTRAVWVVDPDRRTVTLHSATAPTRRLREGDTLDGADVVPGFAVPVRALFEGL
jgi:Uma2 family endonuclease